MDSPPLAAGEPAGAAVRGILRALRAAVEANGAGTSGGRDPERLHDLRVAVRRTRVLLRRLDGVLPAEPAAEVGRECKWLGRLSGPPRDLDVLAAMLPIYLAAVAPRERERLGVLAPEVERERAAARRRFEGALASDRYRRLQESWATLAEPGATAADPPGGHRPILPVATARLREAAGEALEPAGRIGTERPSAELHALRIRCKRLRYLLQLFGALYPDELVTPLLGVLEPLQDRLGELQDLSVHGRLLERLAPRAAAEAPLRRLLVELERRRRAARAPVREAIAALASPESRRRIEELLAFAAETPDGAE